MAGILPFPDYYFDDPDGAESIQPSWLGDAAAGRLQQDGFSTAAGMQWPPAVAYPQPPEHTQIAPSQPAASTPAVGGAMPSALGNLPVPSLPALSSLPLSAIGDRLNAGLMGFAHGGAPIPAIANLISGLITGQRADMQGMALAQQDRAQRAATQYVTDAPDIEPNLRTAMLAHPPLALSYLHARARLPALIRVPRIPSR